MGWKKDHTLSALERRPFNLKNQFVVIFISSKMHRLLPKINIIKKRYFSLSRKIFYEDSPRSEEDDPNVKKVKKHIAEDRARLKWRKPIGETNWKSKFSLFAPDPEKENNSAFLTLMQQPFDLSPAGIKKWKKNRDEKMEKLMQSFIPERHQMLGNDLAAAHFIVHRGGAVKFLNDTNWTKQDENDEYILPGFFDKSYKIIAIKCDNMKLHYEGLENIRRLHNLKFLSFRNVKPFDDWCLDRVSGSEFSSLEVLDLSGTNITERGLNALYRIPTLKLLIIDDLKRNTGMELVCAMIEESYPDIKIVEGKTVHVD